MEGDKRRPKLVVEISERTAPSDAHLREIGRVVVAWAELEADLHAVFRRSLSGHSRAGPIATTIREMRAVAPAALDGADGRDTKALLAMLGDIERLAKERNDVAHSTWWQAPRREPDRSKLLRGRVGVEHRQNISVRSLADLAQRISEADERLQDWSLRRRS